MNVNYEYYRLFYYVCKYHSITRAANVLRMSQPNVTRALNRLEEQLGCKLLVRSTRGVTMTPEGEVLFAHVEIAQEQLQAGESELAGITALESGALTISASETALNVFLLDKLREFHRHYPGVRLRIANHSTPQAIRALGRGLVDLCVITTPARLESTMRRTLLMPFQEILIAGRDFEFLQGRRWALKELQQYPLICLGSETMTYAFYNQFYLSNNLVLQPDTEAATTDQVVPLVKSGAGVCAAEFCQGRPGRGGCVYHPVERGNPHPSCCAGAGWRPCSQRSCARICSDAEQQRYAAECTISGRNCAPAPEN